MKISILVLHDSTSFVPIGVIDLLRKTREIFPDKRDVEVELVSPGDSLLVRGAGGVEIKCARRIAEVDDTDLVIVPAVDPDIAEHIELNRAAVPWIRERYEAGADVASVCTGAFLLAETGLLDNRDATTHWAFATLFAQRYPRVRLRADAILVDHGRVLTSGGATSFLNLTLHVVERVHGAQVARGVSKMFLVDPNKAPQSAYAMFSSQKTHGDEEILKAQQVIEDKPARAPSVERLAKQVAMSTRTFARRFASATGNTPLEYTQRVRIEAAKRALESGERVSAVASRVGYRDDASFRKLFGRITGLSPADYRARYGPASAPSTVTLKRKRA